MIPVEEKTVSVAPLVLLSALDHYERLNTQGTKRVVGCILGENSPNSKTIKVTNSFAIPFEEDVKNSDVWFLDQHYIEQMLQMTKKISAKEKLLGWYHSGPKLKSNDLKINNSIFKKYCNSQPILLVIDVKQQVSVGLPTHAYVAIEQVKDDGTSTENVFNHLPSIIEAEEAEEIGVEHLLRDVRDQAAGGLSIKITNQLKSLKGLQRKLEDIIKYLQKVANKELPVNHTILGKLQDVFNLLPSLGSSNADSLIVGQDTQSDRASNEQASSNITTLNKALTVKTNDELMIMYISQLVRSIIAFDDLIENKIQNAKLQKQYHEIESSSTTKESEKEKEKASDTKENKEGKTEKKDPAKDK